MDCSCGNLHWGFPLRFVPRQERRTQVTPIYQLRIRPSVRRGPFLLPFGMFRALVQTPSKRGCLPIMPPRRAERGYRARRGLDGSSASIVEEQGKPPVGCSIADTLAVAALPLTTLLLTFRESVKPSNQESCLTFFFRVK